MAKLRVLATVYFTIIGSLAMIGAESGEAASPGSPVQHPRLYLDAQKLSELPNLRNRPEYRQIVERLLTDADAVIRRGRPTFKVTGDGDELWQRDVGNAIPLLAAVWAVTRDRKFLDEAVAFADAALDFPTWGRGGTDLSAAHMIYGIAVLYDWAYADIPPQDRQSIARRLSERTSTLYQSFFDGKGGNRAYLQNHLWIRSTALVASALALEPEYPDRRKWTEIAVKNFDTTRQLLGPDGASHEGVGYWEYGVEWMLKYADLAREHLGQDITSHPWFRNTAKYRLYLTPPKNGWKKLSRYVTNTAVDAADSARGSWYGPDVQFFRLASLYKDPVAQSGALQFAHNGVSSDKAFWLALLWFDPEIPTVPTQELPTGEVFPDMGIVSDRTDWSGSEALLVLRCGPPLGHHAQALNIDRNSAGHVHPDVGGFSLFAQGDWFIRNPGYLKLKESAYENSIRIDGIGQKGAGSEGFRAQEAGDLNPQLEVKRRAPDMSHYRCDGTTSYDSTKTGIQLYHRDFIFMKQKQALIVVDKIKLDQPRSVQIDIHPERMPVSDEHGMRYYVPGGATRFRLEFLDSTATANIEQLRSVSAAGAGPVDIPTITFERRGSDLQEVTVLSWGDRKLSVQIDEGALRPALLVDGEPIGID